MSEKAVGFLIKNINDKLKTRADADMKKYNLTFAQSRVFGFLRHRGGQATQKEIELHLEVSHPTVVGIVSRMEQNGYVTTWTGSDRRNKMVQLTSKAEQLGIDLERQIDQNEERLLSPLSPEEAEQLREMLFRIYVHFE